MRTGVGCAGEELVAGLLLGRHALAGEAGLVEQRRALVCQHAVERRTRSGGHEDQVAELEQSDIKLSQLAGASCCRVKQQQASRGSQSAQSRHGVTRAPL
jgi:hypothetical protein